jgi:hypothetical protein
VIASRVPNSLEETAPNTGQLNSLAAVAARGAFNRLRTKGDEGGTRWKAALRSIAVAVVLIGVTDTVFIAS